MGQTLDQGSPDGPENRPADTAQFDAVAAGAWHEALVEALARQLAGASVERIRTHISTVLLAGADAWKIRRPVRLEFLDFSTLGRRRNDCEQELRLNRRTAPGLYLGVDAITGSLDAPSIGGPGPALEYAVHMRRFDPQATLDRLARAGRLTREQVDRLAAAVADLHAAASREPPQDSFGTPDSVLHWALANFDTLEQTLPPRLHAPLAALRAWTLAEHERLRPTMQARRADGMVRECHGDLHLGNVALLEGRPVPFDAIEFNDELRWIDVMSDAAFTFMDLLDHGLPALAWRFVSGYAERSGDYEGLRLLRFHAVYRALVRAKVSALTMGLPRTTASATAAHEPPAAPVAPTGLDTQSYLRLAQALVQPGPKLLLITTGLSGSGKSTVASMLVERLGAVRVRADVERKRLHGLAPHEASGGSIYSSEATRRTYERLAEAARHIVAGGMPAVVDAAFLKRSEREEFRQVAASLGARFAIVACEAPEAVLRERVQHRRTHGADASEATLDVLAMQFQWREPLAADEQVAAIRLDTAQAPEAVEAAVQAAVEAVTADLTAARPAA